MNKNVSVQQNTVCINALQKDLFSLYGGYEEQNTTHNTTHEPIIKSSSISRKTLKKEAQGKSQHLRKLGDIKQFCLYRSLSPLHWLSSMKHVSWT